jgi:chromosome segregation ATPase
MDRLKQELQNIIDEREALTVEREQWQAKWDKLMAQSDKNNIDLIVLREELESIGERVRAWQQRQMKYSSDVKEMADLIRQTIPTEIH